MESHRVSPDWRLAARSHSSRDRDFCVAPRHLLRSEVTEQVEHQLRRIVREHADRTVDRRDDCQIRSNRAVESVER